MELVIYGPSIVLNRLNVSRLVFEYIKGYP